MKFFHIGDLHFGKTLHNIPLVESDQPYWVERFLEAVDAQAVDAVVIAGDIYDRKVPAPEAIRLFDHFLTELAKRKVYVFIIPGNHDAPVRLAHVSALLTSHHIYIAGELQKELMHIRVPGTDGGPDVTFYLMPYLYPKLAADILGAPELTTYDEAARALLAEQQIDPEACNVLVAHQNVLAGGIPPEHSGSETLIGGLGEIDVSAFDAFDYAALGHIHNAQKIGREQVRYAGCPLYYDFSELGRDKRLTMVTVGAGKEIRIERIEIPLLHRLVQHRGTLEELLAAGEAEEDRESVYVQCILCGHLVPPRAMEQLREVYKDALVNVKRAAAEETTAGGSMLPGTDLSALSLQEQFTLFFREQFDELPDTQQEKLVEKILEQQSRSGSDYITDVKSVPEADAAELIGFLLENESDGSGGSQTRTKEGAAAPSASVQER